MARVNPEGLQANQDAIRPKTELRKKESVSGQQGTRGEIVDGVEAKVACVPCMPTDEEVEVHNAAHVPFAI